WDELEPAAREPLFDALNLRQLWVAPAVDGRVAVAALQVPLSRRAAMEDRGELLVASLPERRLFAFELGTGRTLWDHAPPPGWDGKSGSFAQRMSPCASD